MYIGERERRNVTAPPPAWLGATAKRERKGNEREASRETTNHHNQPHKSKKTIKSMLTIQQRKKKKGEASTADEMQNKNTTTNKQTIKPRVVVPTSQARQPGCNIERRTKETRGGERKKRV